MAEPSRPSPWLIALAGWLLPGAGYWLLGLRSRALVIGITIILLFLLGLLFGGIRVIDVPGYDAEGQRVMIQLRRDGRSTFVEKLPANSSQLGPSARWVLRANPVGEIANKPWFVPQSLMGPINFIAARISLGVSQPAGPDGVSLVRASHARVYEIGTLYTAIAGMLNLLAIIDSASRAGEGGKE